MDVSERSLEELRAALREVGDGRALRALLAALEGDPRRGARSLASACARRLAAQRAERRRLEHLFARRARLVSRGARYVAGVDEVGVGPLAGPVVAAAVVLPDDADLPGLNDSKRLGRPARERLDAAIRAQAVAVAVGEVSAREIDRVNVYRAGLEAMRRAVAALAVRADHVLVDARTIPDIEAPQTSIVGGDARDGSIAAASIVAKTHRDALMRRFHEQFPEYGFAQHKGYATAAHRSALHRYGPCPIHRRSFAPVSQTRLL